MSIVASKVEKRENPPRFTGKITHRRWEHLVETSLSIAGIILDELDTMTPEEKRLLMVGILTAVEEHQNLPVEFVAIDKD